MWIPIKPPFGGFETDYQSSDIVILGIPLDLTSTYRTGCRFAPQKIREASFNLETYVPSAGKDLFESLKIHDMGDLFLPSELEEAGKVIQDAVNRVSREGKTPVILGGEHTLTYFACKALKPENIIYIDAHADLRSEWIGQRLCHATVARQLVEEMGGDHVIFVGTRSYSVEEAEFIKHQQIEILSDFSNPKELAGKIKGVAEAKKVYLTIDMDVLDPAYAPGVSCPEPGGISTSQLLELIRHLGPLSLCGVDLVEVCPPFDNGCASFAAARVLYQILAHLL